MTSTRQDPSPRDDLGVTLVELMVVLVIIAVGILAISGVQTRSSSDVFATGRQTRALALAQAQMETVRGVGFTLAVPDSGLSDGFTWQTGVDSVSVDLKELHVLVSWTENGAPHSLQLDNLVSNR